MSPLTIVAKVVAKEWAVEPVKAELLKLIAPTRNESGCIGYTLHQDNENPVVFIFHESWESAASLEQHMNSDHFRAYISAVGDMIEEKVVHKMTRIA
ncbi:MAG: antibiotic biosynthesis monooxygenase [Geobacteraceae bacterium]|nr:antibiotic biosynthesis monooxygenase [Geobacteraceae bacterium]